MPKKRYFGGDEYKQMIKTSIEVFYHKKGRTHHRGPAYIHFNM